MTTQPALVAKQVRLKEWAQQIRDCQNRPKGMDIETWCTQNHLTRANYYYRLRRVREAYLEQMPDSVPTFVELPVSESRETLPEKTAQILSEESKPMIRIQTEKGLSAEVFSGASSELLRSLVESFAYVK